MELCLERADDFNGGEDVLSSREKHSGPIMRKIIEESIFSSTLIFHDYCGKTKVEFN